MNSSLVNIVNLQSQILGLILGFVGISYIFLLSKTYELYGSINKNLTSNLISIQKGISEFDKVNYVNKILKGYLDDLKRTILNYEIIILNIINDNADINIFSYCLKYLNEIGNKMDDELGDLVSLDKIKDFSKRSDNFEKDTLKLISDMKIILKNHVNAINLRILITIVSFILAIYTSKISIMSTLSKYYRVSTYIFVFGVMNVIVFLIEYQSSINALTEISSSAQQFLLEYDEIVNDAIRLTTIIDNSITDIKNKKEDMHKNLNPIFSNIDLILENKDIQNSIDK